MTNHQEALVEESMLIGAEFVRGSDVFESLNPYTRQPWASVPECSEQEVDAAVQAAGSAFASWKTTPGHERARLMHRLADALDADARQMAELETTDNGKVLRETLNQMRFAARNFRFFAGYADKVYGRTIPLDRPSVLDFTVRRPYGVCAIITAWNSPIFLLANKLPAALATGNTVVIKPSEHASVTTCRFARLAREAGFPPGVINVVTGGPRVGDWLTRHPGVAKISFTGGSAGGAAVAMNAAARAVPVTLELGGKSPNIIFDDADLGRAVTGAIAGIFAAAGQTCIAGSRLLVQRGVYDKVVGELIPRARAIALGDPMEPSTEMGPLASIPQLDRVLSMIESARQDRATLLTGGQVPSGPATGDGLFVEPTIFGDVTQDMLVARQEIFGPVLAVMRFEDDEQALEIANSGDYGLAAGVWTQSIGRAHRAIEHLQTGVVWVNTYRSSAAQAPFGGVKGSGYGRERGEDGIEDYTYVQNVMIDYSEDERDPFSVRV